MLWVSQSRKGFLSQMSDEQTFTVCHSTESIHLSPSHMFLFIIRYICSKVSWKHVGLINSLSPVPSFQSPRVTFSETLATRFLWCAIRAIVFPVLLLRISLWSAWTLTLKILNSSVISQCYKQHLCWKREWKKSFFCRRLTHTILMIHQWLLGMCYILLMGKVEWLIFTNPFGMDWGEITHKVCTQTSNLMGNFYRTAITGPLALDMGPLKLHSSMENQSKPFTTTQLKD